MDVIIVGGGVIGMLTALELHDAGARIGLLERQAIGQESSWAGGGILSPLNPWQVPEAITALCRWSQSAYPALAETLHRRSGVDPEWQPSGLMLCPGAERDDVLNWARASRVNLQILDRAAMIGDEPNLATRESEDAFLLPDIAHIRNPRLLAALKKDLELRGVKLLDHHPVDQFEVSDGRISAVVARDARHVADQFVVAAGAWSAQLGALANVSIDIQPVRGQMLIFQAGPGVLKHIVMEAGRYLIPRRDGRILAGSTLEYAGYDKSTTVEAGDSLREFAYGKLPKLRDYPVERHWAGLRPGSPDGVPRIGRHPEISNLYFNCGHFRNGLVMGPASARLLADLMLARHPIVDPEVYRLVR